MINFKNSCVLCAFCVLCFLLFFLPTPLFAQKYRDAKIYIPPVIGVGRVGDNTYFYKQITSEVVTQYHTMVRTLRGSDYVLRSEIEPYTGVSKISLINEEKLPDASAFIRIRGRMEFFAVDGQDDVYFRRVGDEPKAPNASENEEDAANEAVNIVPSQEFLFYIELLDSKTGKILAQQEIIYLSIDESVNQMLSIIVYNMLAGLPDIVEYSDWRDKWFYAGASLFWSPRIYQYEYESINYANIGGGISLEAHFLPFMSAGFGLEITQDWVIIREDGHSEFFDTIFEIPLYIKFVFKPLEQYLIEPYGGITYNFSMMNVAIPFVLSYHFGVQFGFQAGPGMITFNPRFTRDMDLSTIVEIDSQYQRTILHVGLGYRIGLVQKKLASAPLVRKQKVAE
jgi:hypothetical protein